MIEKSIFKDGANKNLTHPKMEKGITLIALIITIIVLLIIAVVTIGAIQDSKIIDHAQNAADDYSVAQEKEMISLGYGEYQISKVLDPQVSLKVEGATVSDTSDLGWTITFEKSKNEYNLNSDGTIEEPIIVTNPYKGKKDWSLAYTCINGAWENTPLAQGDSIPEEATIVAYFYKTGEKITPTFPEGSLPEGEEYHMVVEGSGDMPKMLEGESGFAWQHDQWTGGENIQYNFYVTELTICTGITSIGEGAFFNGMSLKKVTIPSSVTNIKEDAFSGCLNLTEITLPNTITRIESSAFENCFALSTITIPSNVSFIGKAAFLECKNLEKVKILSTNIDFEKGESDNTFDNLSGCAYTNIYVLSEEVKTKLEGTYDTEDTTVKVVTKAEMNSI